MPIADRYERPCWCFQTSNPTCCISRTFSSVVASYPPGRRTKCRTDHWPCAIWSCSQLPRGHPTSQTGVLHYQELLRAIRICTGCFIGRVSRISLAPKTTPFFECPFRFSTFSLRCQCFWCTRSKQQLSRTLSPGPPVHKAQNLFGIS